MYLQIFSTGSFTITGAAASYLYQQIGVLYKHTLPSLDEVKRTARSNAIAHLIEQREEHIEAQVRLDVGMLTFTWLSTTQDDVMLIFKVQHTIGESTPESMRNYRRLCSLIREDEPIEEGSPLGPQQYLSREKLCIAKNSALLN